MMPDSSAKTMQHPIARLFFPGPDLTLLLFNPGLVALKRPAPGLLAAEAKFVQRTGGVTAVVLNAAALMNQRRHAARCPQLRGKAIGHRALHQSLDSPLSLRRAQCWGAAPCGANLQCLVTATRSRISPAHHRAGGAAGQVTDFSERITLIQQSQRLVTPCFDQLRRSPRSRHARAPLWLERFLLYYLRDNK